MDASFPESCSHEEEDDGTKWLEMEVVYKKYSNEEETILKWFAENADIYVKVHPALDKFTILSFSCGTGKKDMTALEAILGKLDSSVSIHYCGVDPHEKSMDIFRNVLSQANLGNVHSDLQIKTYDAYRSSNLHEKTMDGKGQANLILLIDSLCHIPQDPKEVLLHCYHNELAQNGVIVVVLWNANDFWFKIRQSFSTRSPEECKQIEKNDYLTIQEIETICIQQNIKYVMCPCQYNLDIDECFRESEEGALLMECLSCFANVPEAALAGNKSKFRDLLLQEATLLNNRQVLCGNHGVMVIYKE